MKPVVALLSCTVLASIMASTCVRIEILNAECGGILPRQPPAGGNPKWRETTGIAIRRNALRAYVIDKINRGEGEESDYYDDDDQIRPGITLPEAKLEQLSERIREEELNADLRGMVSGWGLLQYLLAPLLLILSVWMMINTERWPVRIAGAVFIAVDAVAIGFALSRSYFTSLGW